MKTTKKQKRTIEEAITVAVNCDSCGEVIPDERSHRVCEVTVEFREGSSFPEGGDVDHVEVDCCKKCFREKVLPLFKQWHEYNSDY